MVTKGPIPIDDYALDQIQERVAAGVLLKDACQSVLEEVIADDAGLTLLKAIGPQSLAYLWRLRQHGDRQTAPQGKRRVDGALLKVPDALLDCLFEVGGQWLRLGDMMGVDCRRLGKSYEKLAESNARKSNFFNILADTLEPEQIVSGKYTNATLLTLYKKYIVVPDQEGE